MAEETGTKEVKESPVQQPKNSPRKPWAPVLTLKKELQSLTVKVGVGREVLTQKNSDGSVTDVVRQSENKELRFEELSKYPCKVARKYHLWNKYEYSPEDYAILMTMTVQEIAHAERHGEWPQPSK